jgi:hypothetical protein
MACVGVTQATALGVEDGVEAGDEHVLGDASQQRLVDLREYLARRRGARGLSGKLQHATGGGHHECCRHPLACCVTHYQSEPALREDVEVVEVASYLTGWLVVRRDPPAL